MQSERKKCDKMYIQHPLMHYLCFIWYFWPGAKVIPINFSALKLWLYFSLHTMIEQWILSLDPTGNHPAYEILALTTYGNQDHEPAFSVIDGSCSLSYNASGISGLRVDAQRGKISALLGFGYHFKRNNSFLEICKIL